LEKQIAKGEGLSVFKKSECHSIRYRKSEIRRMEQNQKSKWKRSEQWKGLRKIT